MTIYLLNMVSYQRSVGPLCLFNSELLLENLRDPTHITIWLWLTVRHGKIHHATWWLIPLSKWVITPVINGISRVIPLVIGVTTHLLSGMSHQVLSSVNHLFRLGPWLTMAMLVITRGYNTHHKTLRNIKKLVTSKPAEGFSMIVS